MIIIYGCGLNQMSLIITTLERGPVESQKVYKGRFKRRKLLFPFFRNYPLRSSKYYFYDCIGTCYFGPLRTMD